MWSIDALLHLRTFVAVAENESFSRAADELMIGQPLLSRRIQTLEREIDTQLFDRSRRQVSLTPIGAALLDPARDLIARAGLVEEFVRSARGRDGSSIAIPPDCDPRSIAAIVTTAAQFRHPVEVIDLAPDERLDAVEDGTVTAALVRREVTEVGFTVDLGLAAAPSSDETPPPSIQLDELRGRRGDAQPRRSILITPEDDTPVFLTNFRRAAAHAGLSGSQIRAGIASSRALVAVLASDDLLVCSEKYAVRNGLAWRPFADSSHRRVYQIALAKPVENDSETRELIARLAPLLGTAVDARLAERPDRRATTDTKSGLLEGWK